MHIQGNGTLQAAGDVAVHGARGQVTASRLGNSAEIDCPACHAAISPLATMCRHCHTNVLEFRTAVERERFRQLSVRVAWVGVAAAVVGFLACFHGGDVLPGWLTTAAAYLGASGAALTAVSVATQR